MLFFLKQKTAYDMRISDWSSDVCSSDLIGLRFRLQRAECGRSLAADAQRAQEFVGIERGRSENLGPTAGSDPAVDLHLPQAIPGMGIAQAEGNDLAAGCPDMGYRKPVSPDPHPTPDEHHEGQVFV